jgi:hypothetical protein
VEEFQLYSKNPKTIHTIPRSVEEDIQPAKEVKGGDTSIPSVSCQTMSTFVSNKQTNITMATQIPQGSAKLNIFEKYDLIKKRNQTLTNSTYAQFWKQTSTTQHRLLSTFNMEKGRMHIAFLQAQVPQPKEIRDYKRSTLVFDTKQVHPADQMDLHRQTGEMVFSTLAHASSTTAKLQVALNNVQTQLKLEKISSFAKDKRIKSLEELVVKIGYDPSNVKGIEELLKKKNADIASLRKQLKLPPTEEALQKKGLLGLMVLNDKLMTLPDYKHKMATMAKDSSKFSGIQGTIMGKAFLETLQPDISVQHEIKYIFIIKPTFAKYTEVDEVYCRLLKVTIPSQLRWEELCNLIK